MALIFEDENKTLGKKQLKVPDEVVKKLKVTRNLFDKYSQSKGFKRINAILDDGYNKRSKKKDKIHNGDKTISGSDAKKIAFEKEHGEISNNPNDLNNIFTKPLFPWLNDAIRSARTSVKKVKAVPPVPKLEKKPADIEDVNKPIKMGNASIRIENASPSKKVIMVESQLLLLKEYHAQQVFNFDDSGNAYFEKNNWQHYIDYLEEIGTYGMLPASQWDKAYVSKAIENAKENVRPGMGGSDDTQEDDYLEAFYDVVCQAYIFDKTMDELFEDFFLELFNDYEAFKQTHNYYNECETLRVFLEEKNIDINHVDMLESYLTDLGKEAYEKTINEQFLDNILEFDMEDGFTYNDRGLIYIERNIRIPNFNSPEFEQDYYDEKYKNYFSYLSKVYGGKGYGGIGNCFSWEEGKGEAYCADRFGAMDTTEIKLKCWIDPKDINLVETVYRNCYVLREEEEVYINNNNAKIEIFDIIIENGEINGIDVSGKSILKKPIIVNP
jgi:hypothetical protein